MSHTQLRSANESDTPVILRLIRRLAGYGTPAHLGAAPETRRRDSLFGKKPAAEVVLAHYGEECAGFALFFPNYSTFLAQPGIHLADLYVKPHLRGKGIGRAPILRLA